MKRISSPAFALFGALALFVGCTGASKESGFESSGGKGSSGGGDTLGGGNGGGSGSLGDNGSSGGGSVLDGGCATATAATSRAPVYMLFVLDGSGSMGQNDKWTAATSALDSIFDDLKSQNDTSFAVGLITFSDQNDKSCDDFSGCGGPYPGASDVSIAIVDQAQHDKLRGRIDSSGPAYDTPTFAALTGGFKELEGFSPQAPLPPNGKKVLVLMSDGEPTDSDKNQNTSLVAAELAKQIQTFAVGIGPFPSNDQSMRGYDPTFMGAIAKAGGTAPANCNPDENSNVANVCHFQVTPGGSQQQLTSQFVDAINKIRGAVATCEFVLDKTGGAVDPSQVNVVYTDNAGQEHVLVQDDQNGWSYDDPSNPTKVILHGSDCDEVRNDPNGKVSIVLGCGTVTK